MSSRLVRTVPFLVLVACSSGTQVSAAPGDGGPGHPADGGDASTPDDADGGESGKALVVNGTETITLASSAGDIDGSCPYVNGVVLSTTIVANLATGEASQTVATARCPDAGPGSDAGSSGGTTDTTVTSAKATSAESSAVINAVETLVPLPSTSCTEDAGTMTITIDRGNGVIETYGWVSDNPDCFAGKPIVDGTALQKVFVAAETIF